MRPTRFATLLLCVLLPLPALAQALEPGSLFTMMLHETTRGSSRSGAYDWEGPRVLPMVGLSRQGSIVGGLVGSF